MPPFRRPLSETSSRLGGETPFNNKDRAETRQPEGSVYFLNNDKIGSCSGDAPDLPGSPGMLERTLGPEELTCAVAASTPPNDRTLVKSDSFSRVHSLQSSPVKRDPGELPERELIAAMADNQTTPDKRTSVSETASHLGRHRIGRPSVTSITPNTSSEELVDAQHSRTKGAIDDRNQKVVALKGMVQKRDNTLSEIIAALSNSEDNVFNIKKIMEIARLGIRCASYIKKATSLKLKPTSSKEEIDLLLALEILGDYYIRLQENMQHQAWFQLYANCNNDSKLAIVTGQILTQITRAADKFQKSRPSLPSSRTVSPAAGNWPTVSHSETTDATFIPPQKKDIEDVLSTKYLFEQSLKVFNNTFKDPVVIEGNHIAAATNLAEACTLYLAKTNLTKEVRAMVANIHDSCARLAAHLHVITTDKPLAAHEETYKKSYTKRSIDYIKAVRATIEELQLLETTASGLQSIISRKINLLRLASNSQYEIKEIIAHDIKIGVIGIKRVEDSKDGSVSYQQLYDQDIVNMVNELIAKSIISHETIVAEAEVTNKFMQLIPAISGRPHVAEAESITAAKIIATLFLFQSNFRQLLCFHNEEMKNKYMANVFLVFDMFLEKLPHIYPKIDFTFISKWIKHDKSGALSFVDDLVIDKSIPGIIAIGTQKNGKWYGKKVEFHVSKDCSNRNTLNMQDFTIMLVTEEITRIGEGVAENVNMIGLRGGTQYYYTGLIERSSNGSISPCPGGKFKYLNEEWGTVANPDESHQQPSRLTISRFPGRKAPDKLRSGQQS